MRKACLACLAALVLASCPSKETGPAAKPSPPQPGTPSQPVAWTDAMVLKLALAMPAPDRQERLELRHEPQPDPARAHLKLVLVLPEGERTLLDQKAPLARRDELWSARWLLAVEPRPGVRRAISWDGGGNWAAVLSLADGSLVFCPHKTLAGINGLPDWSLMLTPERWATGLFETAVWGCDEAGDGCKARSLSGMTVHHSETDAVVLAVSHETEMHAALANLDSFAPDRLLVSGALDACVNWQAGLSAAELEKLGQYTAKLLGPQGPLTEEERKALRLRVIAGRNEAKKTPKDQVSPRACVEALASALQGLQESVPAAGR